MKTNYQTVMENIINNLNNKPKLLLHACCGICSSSVLEKLLPFFDITILFYNPNIYPKEEFEKRLKTLKELTEKMNIKVKIEVPKYNENEFNEISKGLEKEKEGGERCTKCYYLRLNQTAKIGKENNYDYFCTTLSVSPYKNSEKLNKIGEILEKKYKINYLYSDFKKKEGFKRSNELSKKYELYRQNYCGCKYSLRESNKEL